MKQIQNLTAFDTWQIKQALESQNKGRGTLDDLQQILKMNDRIGVVPRMVYDMKECVDSFPEASRRMLTETQVKDRQMESWDNIQHSSLTLEDAEFECVMKAWKHCSSEGLFPRELDYATRLVQLSGKLNSAEALELKDTK